MYARVGPACRPGGRKVESSLTAFRFDNYEVPPCDTGNVVLESCTRKSGHFTTLHGGTGRRRRTAEGARQQRPCATSRYCTGCRAGRDGVRRDGASVTKRHDDAARLGGGILAGATRHDKTQQDTARHGKARQHTARHDTQRSARYKTQLHTASRRKASQHGQ